MKKEQLDIIYLCGCMVNGIKPEKSRVGAMDLEAVHMLAKEHSLSAITYYAVEDIIGIPGTELLKTWRQEREMAIRRSISFDFENRKMLDELEKNGIRHMILKGAVLKDMYPKIGMRQMADSDVLYDKKYQKKVYDIFIENGYYCEDFNNIHHDTYMKEPFYNFEMHTSMLSPLNKLNFYYENIWERIRLSDGKQFEYRFTDEDFYIFLIVHAYQHFSDCGTGLRTLLDFYVYNKANRKVLDYEYIGNECEKMRLRSFEKIMRVLSWKVFSKPDEFDHKALHPKLQKILQMFFETGTYGSFEQSIRNKLNKNAADNKRLTKFDKLKYILHRIFPDKEILNIWCEQYFGAALKYPILLPLAYPCRLIFNGITKSQNAISEIKTLNKM